MLNGLLSCDSGLNLTDWEHLTDYGSHFQYDSIGWAPKEYNPDEKKTAAESQRNGNAENTGSTASQPGFVWDETTGYYYDASSGFYYDGNTGISLCPPLFCFSV